MPTLREKAELARKKSQKEKEVTPIKWETDKNKKTCKKIIKETGLNERKIWNMVVEKMTELKGLLSEEGALFLISKELGVSVDPKADADEKRRQEKANKDLFGTPKKKKEELPEEIKKFAEVVGNDSSKEWENHMNSIVKKEDPLEEVEIVEKPMKNEIIEKHEIVSFNPSSSISLASKDEVKAYWDMYKFVKKSIVDKSDFHVYKGKPSMKKSGWRKFIKPFNLSVEIIREDDLGKSNPRVWEEGKCQDGSPNIHAEVWVRVYQKIHCPFCNKEIRGQSIEAIGYKSKKEYWSSEHKNFGSYNRHALVATARTRGENIGISDLVGFGEVSYEEIVGDPEPKKKSSKKNYF